MGWVVNATSQSIYPREILGTHCIGGRMSQARFGRVRKISPPTGFDPRTVQTVASRYTDYTISAHLLIRAAASNLALWSANAVTRQVTWMPCVMVPKTAAPGRLGELSRPPVDKEVSPNTGLQSPHRNNSSKGSEEAVFPVDSGIVIGKSYLKIQVLQQGNIIFIYKRGKCIFWGTQNAKSSLTACIHYAAQISRPSSATL